jgi:hypothetical protein
VLVGLEVITEMSRPGMRVLATPEVITEMSRPGVFGSAATGSVPVGVVSVIAGRK